MSERNFFFFCCFSFPSALNSWDSGAAAVGWVTAEMDNQYFLRLMAEMRWGGGRECRVTTRRKRWWKHAIIDVLILNISNAIFLKEEVPRGNLKQSSPLSVHLRFKIKEVQYQIFQGNWHICDIRKNFWDNKRAEILAGAFIRLCCRYVWWTALYFYSRGTWFEYRHDYRQSWFSSVSPLEYQVNILKHATISPF